MFCTYTLSNVFEYIRTLLQSSYFEKVVTYSTMQFRKGKETKQRLGTKRLLYTQYSHTFEWFPEQKVHEG